jgi:hypothetical protein
MPDQKALIFWGLFPCSFCRSTGWLQSLARADLVQNPFPERGDPRVPKADPWANAVSVSLIGLSGHAGVEREAGGAGKLRGFFLVLAHRNSLQGKALASGPRAMR